MLTHQVMVVEDDNDIRESVMDFLQDHGYEAVGAGDGREALAKLTGTDRCPCIIILDLMMPVMDGKTFRQEQLRVPRLSGIPVVVISAFADGAATAKELNVLNHVPKPLDLTSLLEVIRQHCAPV